MQTNVYVVFGKSGMHGTEIHERILCIFSKISRRWILAPSEAGPDEIYDYLMEDFEGMKSSEGKSAEEDETPVSIPII